MINKFTFNFLCFKVGYKIYALCSVTVTLNKRIGNLSQINSLTLKIISRRPDAILKRALSGLQAFTLTCEIKDVNSHKSI